MSESEADMAARTSRGFLLRGCLEAVTPGASVGACKTISRRIVLRGPEPRLVEVVLRRELAESSRGVETHREKTTEESTMFPKHPIPFPIS